jgi:hypothetical protein
VSVRRGRSSGAARRTSRFGLSPPISGPTTRLAAIAAEILAEADAVDAAEDEQHGAARGDELPAELIEPMERRERLRQAQQALEAERLARATPVPRDRQARLAMARDRLLEDWWSGPRFVDI